MRRLICFAVAAVFLLIGVAAGMPACFAAEYELEWDYFTPHHHIDRDLNTSSLHILKKISEKNNRSVYGGITITRPLGDVVLKDTPQPKDSSAVGAGPIIMVRNEKFHSGKLAVAIDMSGGFIIYDKVFPAGGKCYNFMWRIGPQFIYKFNENSSMNIGFMLMHVSNAFKGHNPSYNAHGVTLGIATNF